MDPIRRRVVATGIAGLAGSTLPARAQSTWPQRPVRFVVPFAPGGGADVATRMMADQLRTVWGGSAGAVVENKTGGNTVIAANAVLGAPRDGHTFLTTIGLTIQLPHLGQQIPFNPTTDLVPVGAITVEQLVLVVNAAQGIRDYAGLLAAARRTPGGVSFGTFGVGSAAHLTAAQIAREGQVEMTPVHYRGAAPAVQAVLGGEVAVALSNVGSVQQHIQAGRLVPIAVTGARRYKFVPTVPTLTELGVPGLELVSWIGVFAARDTPADIVRKLSADMRTALQAPELVRKITDFQQEPSQMSQQQFAELVADDDAKASKLIRAHKIRLEA